MAEGLFVDFHPKLGRPPAYTPEELLVKFSEYIEDRREHPIVEKETVKRKFKTTTNTEEKEKAFSHPLSIGDFCIYLGRCRNWWNELSDEYLGVKSYIRDYVETYQIKGATVGLFHPNIVARTLGLADKKEISAGEGLTIVVNSVEEKKAIDNMGELDV